MTNQEDSPPRQPLFVPAKPPGRPLSDFTVTGEHTEGAFAMVQVDDWAVGQGTQRHTHTREDEAWYVIKGELTFEIGGQQIVAGAGSFVVGPKGAEHIFSVTQGPASFLMMYWPAGFERLLAEREELGRKFGALYNQAGGRVEPDDDAYRAAAAALPAKYGIINRYTIPSQE